MVKETIINNLTLVPEAIDYDNILKIDTIHAAKGKEVDNVLLVKNVTWKIVQSINNSMDGKDNEMRIHYVGATRARKNLFVVSDRELSNFSI
jgi:DNA helicase-2/ATP-dependent DNA helicase PcrA